MKIQISGYAFFVLLLIACSSSNTGSGSAAQTPQSPGGTTQSPPSTEAPPIETAPKPTGPATRYWIAPGPSVTDVLDLFTRENDWAKSRAFVKVFQMYGGWILNDDSSSCPLCGDNTFNNLLGRNAFSKIKNWGMLLSSEVGAIKWGTPDGCDGTTLAKEAIRIMQRLKSVGSRLSYFSIDNPSLSGFDECHMNIDQIADVMTYYTKTLREESERLYPGEPPVKFILIDSYMYLGADKMIQVMDAILAHGGFIDGIHPDLDYNDAKGRKYSDSKMKSDIQRLQSYANAHEMEFGILMFGVDGSSDKAFYDNTTSWARKYKRLTGGAPPNAVVQSWAWFWNPDGTVTSRPQVLKETDKYSMTRLLLDLDQIWLNPLPWWSYFFD